MRLNLVASISRIVVLNCDRERRERKKGVGDGAGLLIISILWSFFGWIALDGCWEFGKQCTGWLTARLFICFSPSFSSSSSSSSVSCFDGQFFFLWFFFSLSLSLSLSISFTMVRMSCYFSLLFSMISSGLEPPPLRGVDFFYISIMATLGGVGGASFIGSNWFEPEVFVTPHKRKEFKELTRVSCTSDIWKPEEFEPVGTVNCKQHHGLTEINVASGNASTINCNAAIQRRWNHPNTQIFKRWRSAWKYWWEIW